MEWFGWKGWKSSSQSFSFSKIQFRWRIRGITKVQGITKHGVKHPKDLKTELKIPQPLTQFVNLSLFAPEVPFPSPSITLWFSLTQTCISIVHISVQLNQEFSNKMSLHAHFPKLELQFIFFQNSAVWMWKSKRAPTMEKIFFCKAFGCLETVCSQLTFYLNILFSSYERNLSPHFTSTKIHHFCVKPSLTMALCASLNTGEKGSTMAFHTEHIPCWLSHV